MPTIEERIAILEEKLKQEKAKKQKIEARKKALISKQNRAMETRKKILVGAAILNQINIGNWNMEELNKIMNSFLKKEEDRKLFDLKKIEN